MKNVTAIACARSADLKLQAWGVADDTPQIWTRWKSTPGQSSIWTNWQEFPELPNAQQIWIQPCYGVFATQLPKQVTAQGSKDVPDEGRMQLWAYVQEGNVQQGFNQYLYTTAKSSEQPNVSWLPWENFGTPSGQILSGAVVPLSDGRLQIWIATDSGQLWSKVLKDPNLVQGYTGIQNWSDWVEFPVPNSPKGITFQDLAACQLPDGQTQLWGLAYGGQPVWTCIRDATPGTLSDPLSGWGPWSEFELVSDNPIQAISAVTDGKGRAYFWFAHYEMNGYNPNVYWEYVYTNPSPSPTVAWNGPVSFPYQILYLWSLFPTYPTPPYYYSNRCITFGVLPDGELQLFLLANVPLSTNVAIYTTWQTGQSPTTWNPGPLNGWSDFSVP